MTLQEINQRIEEGSQKAKQRRNKSGNLLGVRRTRRVAKTIYEEIEVSIPCTKEEIKKSIEAGYISAQKRKEEVKEAKEHAKVSSQKIREYGYKLDYELIPDRTISIAYKWDFPTGMTTVYFAVRSKKDQFSRKAARQALLAHMSYGTHEIKFKAKNPTREEIFPKIITSLISRARSHPSEFPSGFLKRKEIKKFLSQRGSSLFFL